MISVGAVVGSRLADRIGYRAPALAGFALSCAGFLLVTHWGAEPGGFAITRDLMIIGFGMVIASINDTVTTPVGPLWMATGVAFVTVTRTMGSSLGMAWLGSWGLRRFNDLASEMVVSPRTSGMSDAEYAELFDNFTKTLETPLRDVYAGLFLAAAILMGLAVIPAIFFYQRKKGLSWWKR